MYLKMFRCYNSGATVVALDDEIKEVILSFLAKWKSSRTSKEKLLDLKEAIIKKTGAKSLPLSTLKKWVRKVAREAKQAEKLKQLKYEAPITPIAAPLSDKIFLQAFSFDMEAMKKTIERMINRLEEMKKLVEEEVLENQKRLE